MAAPTILTSQQSRRAWIQQSLRSLVSTAMQCIVPVDQVNYSFPILIFMAMKAPLWGAVSHASWCLLKASYLEEQLITGSLNFILKMIFRTHWFLGIIPHKLMEAPHSGYPLTCFPGQDIQILQIHSLASTKLAPALSIKILILHPVDWLHPIL